MRSAPEPKTARSTPRLKARRGAGTICMRSCAPSARSSARSGEITVVLPSPMSIWWQSERPARAPGTSLRSSCTCVGFGSGLGFGFGLGLGFGFGFGLGLRSG